MTPYTFLYMFYEELDVDSLAVCYARFYCEVALLFTEMLRFKPSVIAGTALWMASRLPHAGPPLDIVRAGALCQPPCPLCMQRARMLPFLCPCVCRTI